MTERSVKRVMLGATIASVAVLTALGVAGLVVTSRGPQAQALPLVRTLIAEADAAGPTEAVAAPGTQNDQPQHSSRSHLGATTTTALVVALAEAPETAATTGTSRTNSSNSRTSSGNTSTTVAGDDDEDDEDKDDEDKGPKHGDKGKKHESDHDIAAQQLGGAKEDDSND